MTPDDRLKLARHTYWQYMEAQSGGVALCPDKKERCLRGELDQQHGVKIALAALSAGRKAGLEEAAEVAGNTPIDVEAIWRAIRNIPTEGNKRLHQHFITGNAKVNFCHEIAAAIRKFIDDG